jgi:uncharacterized membrane protein YbhN (UPF0104 family)
MLLILTLCGLGLASLAQPGPTRFGAGLEALVEASPGLFNWFWEIAYGSLLLWPLVLLGASLIARDRLALARDLVLALLMAAVAVAIIIGDVGDLAAGLARSSAPAIYPAARLAIAIAVISTASPHLGRPVSRLGRWVIAMGSLAAIALGIALPVGVLAGIVIGVASAATVHLIFGSPGGRPSLSQVAASLADLGIDAEGLDFAALQPRGVALVRARDHEGRMLVVKVYGRDARDGQFLAAAWASLWYREAGRFTLGRWQQVEHEAFVSLFAERNGVQVPEVRAAGTSVLGDALLVLALSGRRLDEVPAADVTDEVLSSAWEALVRLHGIGVAHGRLDGDRILLQDDGSVMIADLGTASLAAAPAEILADRAQLLVTTSLIVGQDRAVTAALSGLGSDGLSSVFPFLQPAVLTSSAKRTLKRQQGTLDGVRDRAAEVTGTQPPKLEQLRRFTRGTLLQIAVLLAATYFLVTGIAGIGIDQIVQELREADQAWIWMGLIIGVASQAGQAFSTMGASIRRVTFLPAFMLQLAIQFMALAVPSSAARIAMNVRFFQLSGTTVAGALAVGGIDSISGFLVQATIILLVLTGVVTLDLQLDLGGDQGGTSGVMHALVIVLVVLAILALIGAVAVPRYRRMIGAKLAEARGQLRVLRSPSHLTMLFGGNLAAQLLLAAALGVCTRAFGYRLGLADLLVINTIVSLFAGIMPVPGGIGVTEAALTMGLTTAGVPESAAFASAVTFRLVTFYLPPIWGAVALRWLKREGYL